MAHQSNHEKGNTSISISYAEYLTRNSAANQTEWTDYNKISNSTEDGNQITTTPPGDNIAAAAAIFSSLTAPRPSTAIGINSSDSGVRRSQSSTSHWSLHSRLIQSVCSSGQHSRPGIAAASQPDILSHIQSHTTTASKQRPVDENSNNFTSIQPYSILHAPPTRSTVLITQPIEGVVMFWLGFGSKPWLWPGFSWLWLMKSRARAMVPGSGLALACRWLGPWPGSCDSGICRALHER